MSRIGKQLIILPDGVEATIQNNVFTAKGPKGELVHAVHPDISVVIEDKTITCTIMRKTKKAPALWGTTRAVLASLVKGVHEGFEKKLEIQGVGYRAAVKGSDLELNVGYSHPVTIAAPDHISFNVEKEIITVSGINAVVVGQVASDIRRVRPPEPYKGKGIRYVGEHVRRKVGKVVGAGAE